MIFNKLDKEAVEYGVLTRVLITLKKNSKVLQTHDYKIIEDPDFKGEILDVGAGPGVLAIMAKLKNPNLDISIMDGSMVNLEIANTLMKNAGIMQSDIEMLLGLIGTRLSRQYDTIVLNHILEHLDNLDDVFDWIMEATTPGGTIFIAVPYKDCHWSPNHKHFFKITKDNNIGMYGKEIQCTDIEKYLKDKGYEFNIEVFDESKVDKRQPYNSRGQLDMVIKIKKPKG